MSQEISADITTLYSQSKYTGSEYFDCAYNHLSNYEDLKFTADTCVELAKIMQADFSNALMCAKIQEIRDSFATLADALERIAVDAP